MLISISGTPGTGKTKTAEILAAETGYKLLSIKYLIRKYRIKTVKDSCRQTRIVDIKDIRKAFKKEVIDNKNIVIEGHLSHYLPCKYVFVLRTEPDYLSKRLKKRKWLKSKITENIQAEILDEITAEALGEHRKSCVFEMDTTNKSAKSTATIIKKILNNSMNNNIKYRTGQIRWLKTKYLHYLEE